MSDYNDGNWHAWNGGECPVHPLSEVEYLWHDEKRGKSGLGGPRIASQDVNPCLAWSHVFRFRVVKEHKEPREFWIREYAGGYEQSSAQSPTSFKVREVLDNE